MAKKKSHAKKHKKQKKISSKHIAGTAIVAVVILIFLYLFLPTGEVVATVNGEKIYLSEVKELYDSLPATVQTPELGERYLDYMIQIKLLTKEAKKQGITATQEEIDIFKAQYVSTFGEVDPLSNDIENIYLTKKLLDESVTVNVSEEEIEAFYEANKAELASPERVNARHILIATREEAEDIREQLIDGADFESLAKEYSTEPAAQQSGGNLGWFARGQMVAPFEYVAFSTRVGVISQPIQTQFGWHIIEVLEKQREQVPDYDLIKPQIVDHVTNQKKEIEFQIYLSSILESAKIEKISAEELIALLQ